MQNLRETSMQRVQDPLVPAKSKHLSFLPKQKSIRQGEQDEQESDVQNYVQMLSS